MADDKIEFLECRFSRGTTGLSEDMYECAVQVTKEGDQKSAVTVTGFVSIYPDGSQSLRVYPVGGETTYFTREDDNFRYCQSLKFPEQTSVRFCKVSPFMIPQPVIDKALQASKNLAQRTIGILTAILNEKEDYGIRIFLGIDRRETQYTNSKGVTLSVRTFDGLTAIELTAPDGNFRSGIFGVDASIIYLLEAKIKRQYHADEKFEELWKQHPNFRKLEIKLR